MKWRVGITLPRLIRVVGLWLSEDSIHHFRPSNKAATPKTPIAIVAGSGTREKLSNLPCA
jgi:hypothetical protein